MKAQAPRALLCLIALVGAGRARADAKEAEIVARIRAQDAEAARAFEAARAAGEVRDHEGAMAGYRKVLARLPDQPDAHRRLCGLLVQTGQQAEGLAHCEAALAGERSPANLATAVFALLERAEPGDEERAEALANEALEQDGDGAASQEARFWLARHQRRWVDVEDALKRLEAGAAAGGDEVARVAAFYGSAADAALEAADLERAARLARRGLELRPESSRVRFVLGRSLIEQHKADAAREQAAQLLARGPQDPAAHYFAAVLLAQLGELGEARDAVERALDLGLPQEVGNGLRDLILDNQPWYERYGADLAWAFGLWLAGLAALALLGVALSWVTARAARSVAPDPSRGVGGLAGRLRGLYRAVLWACCTYYYVSVPMVLAAVVLGGGAVFYAFVALGRIPIKLVLLLSLLVLVTFSAVLRSLFVRVKDEDPGELLALDENPRLASVLREVAERVGTRPVDKVFMTPDTDVAVFERGGLFKQLGGRTERCLILGAGVLEGMDVQAFKAILAHEYGHFTNRDTAGGGFALAVQRSMGHTAQALAEGGAAAWYNPAWLFLNGFVAVFLRISHGASRLQEVLADRWAAALYGGAAFSRGLRHVIERSVRFGAHAQATLREVVEAEQTPRLDNLYHFNPAASPQEPELAEAVEEELNREASSLDSHPAPRERFAFVARIDAELGETVDRPADDGGPVWALFADREGLERRMTDEVRQAIELQTGVVIGRSDPFGPPATG